MTWKNHEENQYATFYVRDLKKKRGYIVLFAFCILHKENTEKIRKNLLTGKARMVVERWLLNYGWD